jgi:hypothetical protein
MDFYNIAISCIIYILVIISIEGILYYNILSIIFGNILNGIIDDIGLRINEILNEKYSEIAQNMKVLGNDSNNNKLISLVLKLYLMGTFSSQILSEQDYILINSIKSYIYYAGIIVCVFVALAVIKIININVFDNKLIVRWLYIFINVIVAILLIGIFVLPITLVVFINIQENFDTNTVTYKILANFKKLYNNYFNPLPPTK